MGNVAAADSDFALLRQVVEDAYHAGRSTFAAGIKPEIQRRTHGEFTEGRIGFRSFREFLEAAQGAGYVRLEWASGGGRLRVVPPDAPVKMSVAPPLRRLAESTMTRRRIRPDFWHAFVDWNEDVERFYDRVTDRALMLRPEDEYAERVRTQRAVNSNQFVPIKHIPFVEQLEWMREFAESVQDSGLRQVLLHAFESQKPAAAFATAVRSVPQLAGAWFDVLVTRVYERIRTWAGENEVETDLVSERPMRVPGDKHAAGSDVELMEMRARLHALIDRMSLGDLARIPIPAGYLLEK